MVLSHKQLTMKPSAWNWICFLSMIIVCDGHRALAEPTGVDFQRDIRPLLSDRCFHCHGPDETSRKADLRLDQESSARNVLRAGDPDNSELLRRVFSKDAWEVMPPPEVEKPLTRREAELLRTWVSEGAQWAQHWAYEQPRRWPVPQPAVDSSYFQWPAVWIDQFLLEAMQQNGLVPTVAADSLTLVRRIHFDLTGLPPSPSIIEAPPQTDEDYLSLVEQLLHSPHFGERMAMVWLDWVRYADTVGYHGDQDHSISPYRDWVIDAFNSGMSFDQMTREQLAGDLLPQPTTSQRIATGYNRLLQTTHEGGLQPGEYRVIYAADRVRNLSGVWLGATVGCAQCHDHKFDPYTMRDFYSLAAFFADVDDESHFKTGSNDLPTRRDPEIELPTPEQEQTLSSLKLQLAEFEQQLLTDTGSPEEKQQIKNQKRSIDLQLKEVQKQVRRTMVTVALAEPRTTRILPRGDWMDKSGHIVVPAFPQFMMSAESNEGGAPTEQLNAERRLNRLDLANWLTDSQSGIGLLTARVMVNRLWYLFFGRGLAGDLSDFGNQGQVPSHPELLDNLAHYFIDQGWDFRSVIRLIVSSRAYRQSSAITEMARQHDPENRWFARQAAFRLPAEMIRDNALAISGLLVPTIGGPSAKPYQPAGYYRHLNFPTREYHADTDQNQWRRGVYVHWQRQFLHPMMRNFDATNREECTTERARSNTPLAALTLLNDPTFVEASRALAECALDPNTVPVSDIQRMDIDRRRIEWLIQRITCRIPTAEQLGLLQELLDYNRIAFQANPLAAEELLKTGLKTRAAVTSSIELAAWSEVCRALLNLAETNMRY